MVLKEQANDMNLSKAMRVLITQYVAQEDELALCRKETLEVIEDIAAGQSFVTIQLFAPFHSGLEFVYLFILCC